jgi:hypothetical protein
VNRKSLKETLEISTNVAVLLVAVAALTSFAISHFLNPNTPNLRSGLEKGMRFESVPGVDYHAGKRTLLIALNTNCSYCRESLPFYRKLIFANRQSNNLRIIAVFPNPADEITKYAKENELLLDTIADVNFSQLNISGTPTLVLINDKAEVDDFWVGKLSDTEADQLVSSVTSTD